MPSGWFCSSCSNSYKYWCKVIIAMRIGFSNSKTCFDQ
nr:MAG TPA: hypothetical protein [Bacteriophage sp.]